MIYWNLSLVIVYIIPAQSVSIAGKIDVHSSMRSRFSGEKQISPGGK